MIAWLLGGAVAVTAAVMAAFYLLQHRIVLSPRYYPNRSLFVERSANYRLESVTVADGVVLEGVVYEPDAAPAETLLYFGGREQDSVMLAGKLSLHFPGVRCIAFNYRGYGLSSGKVSQERLYDDALIVYDRIAERFGACSLLGYSIGASVAAFVGAARRPRRVILVAPFVSVERLIRERLPAIPAWLIRCKHDVLASVRALQSPLYLFASADDEMVPPVHVRILADAAPTLAEFKEFGGYNHAQLLFSEEVETEIAKVLSR